MTILYDLDEAEYHRRPELSSTQARRLLESPAKFKHSLTHTEGTKPAFDLGSAVHSKVLGVGAELAVIPAELLAVNGAASTAAAKEFIAQARADGLIPVKADVAAERDAMAEAVLAHTTARGLLSQDGNPEASVFTTDPDTGVEMRARFDYLADVAVDLKTARDASPRGWARAAAEHGYHIQRGHYDDAYLFTTGAQLRGFVFVVVESEAPYLVGVYRLNSDWEDVGLAKARQARRIYRQCVDTDTWPGYGDEIQSLLAPFWLLAEAQEEALT